MSSDARWPRRVRWALPVLALGVGIAAGVAACSNGGSGGSGSGPLTVSRSSSIALAEGERTLWLTSPDDDRIVEVDASTLAVRREVAVDGQPAELAWSGTDLVVTGAQRTSVALVSIRGASTAVHEIAVPCGGTRGVVTSTLAGRRYGFVTCPNDDLVAVVDLDRRSIVGAFTVARRPTGIVRRGDDLTVSTAGDGWLHTWSVRHVVGALEGAPRPSASVRSSDPTEARAMNVRRLEARSSTQAWADGDRETSVLGALDVGQRGVVGTYQVIDDVRPLSSSEVRSDPTYGTPLGGRPRIEAALAGPCGARFSDVDEPARRASGPVALATDQTSDLVWVVGQFSRSVSVVRCDGGRPSSKSPTVASFEVGDGPRGIVLATDGRTAFVDVGFDHAVARLALPDGAAAADAPPAASRRSPELTVRRKVHGYLSPLAQAGRSMFFDATNTHLTPFGLATCASCHPDAGEDGRTWRIETEHITEKLRRTQPLWGTDETTKPLHWSGELTSTDDLVLQTIQELLGGDGLLVDTAAFDAYLREVLPPPAPPTTPALVGSGSLAARGEELFESDRLGCSSCHAGTRGTDGALHSVLGASKDPAARLAAVVTPPLTDVRGRAPYGHDGRAADLTSLLADHGDGTGSRLHLTDDEVAALIAYLRSR